MEDSIEQELADLIEEKKNVIDDASDDDSVIPERYDISSYGADYDVDGLVKRLGRGDILIPPFQRDYVWSLKDASRFIESLLLGLPVPGVFLAKDAETNKLLVIDGQQRLKSLQFFFAGYFNPRPNQKTRRIFKLTSVQSQYEGKTYEELDEKDRVQLNDSIIHATIIKQDAPANDDTSVYHVFERLNTGGRKLTPQEIRVAIYGGKLVELLSQLNEISEWREIFGPASARLKDQELILRFLALYHDSAGYAKPMNEFLNKFAKRNRSLSQATAEQWSTAFEKTVKLVHQVLGRGAFRPERAINAAVFDSIMIGIARRLQSDSQPDKMRLAEAYHALMANSSYKELTSLGTSDTASVAKRLDMATSAFKNA